MRSNRTSIAGRAVWYVIMSALAVVMILPLYFMIVTSFMEITQINRFPPELIPSPWTLRSFTRIFEGGLFPNYLANTVFITVFSLTGVLLSSSLTAFGFACLNAKSKNVLFVLMLSTMMIPGTVTMIPTFVLFSNFKWVDTYLPLIIPCYFGGGAFNIFLLKQFFSGMPSELKEAARIDGCGWFRVYWQIYIPNAKTALLVVFLFSLIGTWGDYMGPLIYLVTPRKYTLSLGITLFKSQYSLNDPGPIMAYAFLSVLPILVLYCFFQKYFVEGIVTTGIKG